MEKPATLQMVADAAGVARSTASRALRNHPSIPESTRGRIREIAERIGYRKDPMVAALMARLREGRPGAMGPVIGYVTLFPPDRDWRATPTFGRFYAGAAGRADRLGYRLEEFALHEAGTMERLVRILRTRSVHGLIFAPVPEPGMKVEFPWSGFSIAAIGVTLEQAGLYRVRNNPFQATGLALEHLRALGYERIGFFIPEQVDRRGSYRWRAAFLLDQQLHDTFAPEAISIAPAGKERESFDRWLESYRPEVVIGNGRYVLDWIRESGYRVPEDAAFASVGLGPGDPKDIAGIDQRLEIVGAHAVDLVVEQLQRNERGLHADPKTVLINGTWRNGGTAPPRPGAKGRCARKKFVFAE